MPAVLTDIITASTAHVRINTLTARQQQSEGGGGGGISAGAVIGIIVAVVLVLILVIGIFIRGRRHRSAPNAYFPSQKKSIFAFAPTQAQPQYLPTYVPPSSPYGAQNHGSVAMPQAVYPSTGGGYYARAQPGQGEDRVRFGQVGVVRF